MKPAYRVLSLLLALCMILSVVPFGALAEGESEVCQTCQLAPDACTCDKVKTPACLGEETCANGHVAGCPLYVACTGEENCPGTVHTAPCQKACQQYEGCAGGTHSSDCCLFVCNMCQTMGGGHSDSCPSRCQLLEGCKDGAHDAQCVLYLCQSCGKNVCECEALIPEQQKSLVSVAVTSAPVKTDYTQGETLDVTGGKLTLTYSDDSTQIVDITADMVSGFDSSVAQSLILTVTYEGKEAAFVIRVLEAAGQEPTAVNADPETITGRNYVTIKHRGEDITVGMGMVKGGGVPYIKLNTSDSRWSYNQNEDYAVQDVCFAASGADGSTYTDESFYNAILNSVTFSVVSCENKAGASSPPNLNIEAISELQTVGAVTTKFATLYAASGNLFDAIISMDFTYAGQPYSVTKRIWYEKDSISLTIGDDVTDLSSIFSSNQAFFGWLKTNHENLYHSLECSTSSNNWIEIRLPATNLGDVKVNLSYSGADTSIPGGNLYSLQLIGSRSNGRRTTMNSIRFTNQVHSLADVDFVANGPNQVAIAPDNEYGRLPATIMNCSFEDYTTAISLTGMGNVGYIAECKFQNCTTGILLDSRDSGDYGFYDSADYCANVFFKCGTAVNVQKLPSLLRPYDLRFNRNIFLFNDLYDFVVAPAGTFYFQENFYSHSEKESNKNIDYWMSVDDATANQIRNNVKSNKGNDTRLITNPFLKKISGFNNFQTIQPLWLTDKENGETVIFARKAASMPIDTETFDAVTGEIEIAIVDDQENQIAQWVFDAIEGGNAQ